MTTATTVSDAVVLGRENRGWAEPEIAAAFRLAFKAEQSEGNGGPVIAAPEALVRQERSRQIVSWASDASMKVKSSSAGVFKEPVEAAGEVALEAVVCFASCLAFVDASRDVGDRGRVRGVLRVTRIMCRASGWVCGRRCGRGGSGLFGRRTQVLVPFRRNSGEDPGPAKLLAAAASRR